MRAENDLEILKNAFSHEEKRKRTNSSISWEGYNMGATVSDLNRLKEEGQIEIVMRSSAGSAGGSTLYKLTEKGRNTAAPEVIFERPSSRAILEAMETIIGFDDVKQTIAGAIQARKKVNFLLEGPPACAKSLMIEAVRESVSKAYLVFGSRTSGSGLSDVLFSEKPEVLLMDEADKMKHDVFSVLLGLLESGEIIETKKNNTRGVKLNHTIVIAACNSSVKMPPEFISRFALHVNFPRYTRAEFIEVCEGMLTREECPLELARLIGETVYDMELGDIRSARGVWQLVNEPTREEVERVIHLKNKYSPAQARKKRHPQARML